MNMLSLKTFAGFNNDYRIIPTGLCGEKAMEILRSIEGQLSDGRWENVPQMEKYWKNECIIIDDEEAEFPEILIVVSNKKYDTKKIPAYYSAKYGMRYQYKYINNPFAKMNDTQIRNWFANKIYSMVNYEQNNNGDKKWWTKNPAKELDYLGYTNKITVGDCKAVFKKLKSF